MAEPSDPNSLPKQPSTGPHKPAPPPVTPATPSPRRGGWQPPKPADLQPSFPAYEIRGILGRGGMGAVYQGWQKSLDRLVAIKILPPDLDNNDANFAERFKRVAKAMARFAHPGIVSVFDAGETPDGLLYFIMEYIEGTDVQKMVRTQGPLPPAHALAITAHVCDALAYAHKRGVIHRDIKPANIMVDAEGQVKVADFGLAKVAADDSALVTDSHIRMGTPDFIAPEVMLMGMASVDHRADLYAVGVMLYQMLTGHVPRGRFEVPSRRVPGLDVRFDGIIDHAMQTDPEKRYSSATEIRTDLDKILAGPLPPDAPASPPPAVAEDNQKNQARPTTAPPPSSIRANPPPPAVVPVKKGGTGILIASVVAAILAALATAILLPKFHPRQRLARGGTPVPITPAPVTPRLIAVTPAPATPALVAVVPPPATPVPAPVPATPAPVPTAPSPPAATTPAPVAAQQVPIRWFPALHTPGEISRANHQQGLGLAWRKGWIFPVSAAVDWSSQLADVNGGIRARFRYVSNGSSAVPPQHRVLGQVLLRSADGAAYGLRLRDDHTAVLYYSGPADAKGSAAYEELASTELPQRVGSGGEYLLQLVAFGRQITARFNETEVAVVDDARLRTRGNGGVFSYLPVRDIEVLRFGEAVSMDPANPANPLAAETLILPFTNSLGMKFVPVKGTGVFFCIHETRRQDYAAYAAEKPAVNGDWSNAMKDGIPVGKGDDHPVVSVSWEDAQAFCTWLSKKEGRAYRLPTDREWSVAVGLGLYEQEGVSPQSLSQNVTTEFPWGGTYPPKTKDSAGNYADTAWKQKFPKGFAIEGYTDGFPTTAPVMKFKPNKLGLHDLGGNVWEWVDDWHSDTRTSRVLRGGSWNFAENYLIYSSNRPHFTPSCRKNDFGFRCVVETRSSGSASGGTIKSAP